ncbi:MAG TPA: hypothetical protein PKY85_00770 [Nitrosomonas sp.]|nr:hypothetical protein [Nitrosomonas sp.]
MLNVFITVDTEIWCDGWEDLDRKFPKYFKSYVYGPTPDGNFALPGTLSILEEYNIPAVFFVEPLFSEKFGIEPLKEIVGLLQEKNQEIQLHMHPEWVDEVGNRLLPAINEKIPNMTHCTREQQSQLIRWAIQRMSEAVSVISTRSEQAVSARTVPRCMRWPRTILLLIRVTTFRDPWVWPISLQVNGYINPVVSIVSMSIPYRSSRTPSVGNTGVCRSMRCH